MNSFGQVESLRVAGESQDVFKREGTHMGQGNQLVLFDDVPLYWDAWDTMDYHLETGRVLNVKVRVRCESVGMCVRVCGC